VISEDLPQGWTLVKLDDTGQYINGFAFKPNHRESTGLPIIRIQNLTDESKPLNRTTIDVPQDYLVLPGDMLVSWSATLDVFIWRREKALVNQHIFKVVPDEKIVNKVLLFHWLKKSIEDLQKTEHLHGSTMKHINRGPFLAHEVPLPPLTEQTRIAEKLEELLTGLDAGVAELKAAQKKLAQYRQSLLKAAVEGALTAEWRANNKPAETGAQLLERILQERRARWEAKQLAKFKEQGKAPPKDWQKKYPEPVQPDATGLPELPQGWVWASVEQLSESVRNGLSKTPNTEQRGFPIFKINAVRPMAVNFNAIKHIEIDESEAADYWVEVGDVLATRYNGSVDLLGVFGMVKNVPERTLHPDKLIRMKPLTGADLGAWMELCGNVGLSRKHLVARVKTTAGQTGISGEDLKRTPIPLPPVAEQKIALAVLEERLQAIRELELPTELGLKQSTAQRQNILKAAFSGQLVPQDPSDEPASELLERIRAERAAQQAIKKPRGRKAKEAA
jgi:type I restriction enzyme S subunit